MLLAIDVSNTTIKVGVFDGDRLVSHFRFATDRGRQADEYAMLMLSLFREHAIERAAISGVVMSCVVPPLRGVFRDACERYLGAAPVIVSHEGRTGIVLDVEHPREVGADRIANALAIHRLHGGPAIGIAFGTATVFDCLSADGRYLGGAIAPGMVTALESLASRAAQLFQIALEIPDRAIGRNTVSTMQSGVVLGFAGLVEGLVTRLSRELGGTPKVVATGGLAEVVAPATTVIHVIDPHLTLRGLSLYHAENR